MRPVHSLPCFGPNYDPYWIRPVNRPLFFWAHTKTGFYFSLLNARLAVRPDNSFSLLAAMVHLGRCRPGLTLGPLTAHAETGIFLA